MWHGHFTIFTHLYLILCSMNPLLVTNAFHIFSPRSRISSGRPQCSFYPAMAVPQLLRFQKTHRAFAVTHIALSLWWSKNTLHIFKAETLSHPANASSVTKQNQMWIKSARQKGLGSLAHMSHCPSALTHTFPKAAFPEFHNPMDRTQMLHLQIRSHSREAEALPAAEKPAPLLSPELGVCPYHISLHDSSMSHPGMKPASPRLHHSILQLQPFLKAIIFILIITCT